jgi:hypothetical protein
VTSEGGLDLRRSELLRQARRGHDGGFWRGGRECLLRGWWGILSLLMLMFMLLLLLFSHWDWSWSSDMSRVVEVVAVGRRES